MRVWIPLAVLVLAVHIAVPAPAGTWPVEAETEEGVIDRQGLFERDHRVQAQLDSLYDHIDLLLQEGIREAIADSLDSLEVSAALQRRDLFLEARRAWATYCRATTRSVFFKYFGGSIAVSAERQFRIGLIEAQMQELKEIYFEE